MGANLHMAGTALILLAVLLDLAIGDPQRILHPVVVMGRLISALEKLLYKGSARPASLIFRGALLAIITVSASYALFAAVNYLISPLPGLWWLLNIWFAGTTLAGTSLAAAAKAVYLPLVSGDLPGARRALSMIVSRDCENLAPGEIVRGAVESVAENTSDGVVAPLLYLALGGVPLAMAYKAVNTLDSMLGYKNSRYLWFGRAAARIDDAANWLPARLTALFMVAAAFITKRDWRNTWRILLRDKGKHPSPNSGRPEAAMAGALGVSLGGGSRYFGKTAGKPLLGEAKTSLRPEHIIQAVGLMRATSALALLGLMVGRMVIVCLF